VEWQRGGWDEKELKKTFGRGTEATRRKGGGLLEGGEGEDPMGK